MHRAGGARGDPSVGLWWKGQARLQLQGTPKGQTLATLPEPFPSTSAQKFSACSWSPTAGRAASACQAPPPKRCLPSETAKPEPISSMCPPARGAPPGSDPQSRSLPLPPHRQQLEQDTRAGAQMQQILFQIIWLLAVGGLVVGWVQL